MTIIRRLIAISVAALVAGALAACGQAKTPEVDFDGATTYPNGAQLQYHFRLATVAGDKGNAVACEIDTKDAGSVPSSLTHVTCGEPQIECKQGRVTGFQLNLNGWLAGTFVGADPAHPSSAHYAMDESNNRFGLATGGPAGLPADLMAVPISGSGKALAECGEDGALWTSVISETP